MKWTVYLFFIFTLHLTAGAQTNTLTPNQEFSWEERRLLSETAVTLTGSVIYNSIASSLVVAGTATFAIGLTRIKDTPVGAIGFVVGFGGGEMLKFSPVPLVKAHRNLLRLRHAWKDTVTFNEIYRNVNQAATCIKISVASTFIGETLIFLALVNHGNKGSNFLLGAGITVCSVAVCTNISAAILAQQARRKLGNAMDSFGFTIGRDGIGATYRFR